PVKEKDGGGSPWRDLGWRDMLLGDRMYRRGRPEMTVNEVAGLLGYSRERVERLIAEGLVLPRSGAMIKLQVTNHSGATDISDDQFNEFVNRFEAEEPGRWPPAAVRRNLLVEAKHRCAICGDCAPLQFHHMLDWAKLKHHDARHMVALCGTCHTRCTNG